MTQTLSKQKVTVTKQNETKYDRFKSRWYTPSRTVTRTIRNVQIIEGDDYTWKTGEVTIDGKTWTCDLSWDNSRCWHVCKGYHKIVS